MSAIYISPPFGCSTPCIDSLFNVAPFGGQYGCEDFLGLGVCDGSQANEAKSHCPLTCSACPAFQCVDSVVPWTYNGGTYTCSLIANLSETDIEYYCAFEILYSTCRETCGYCLPISTDVPTVSPTGSLTGTNPPNSGEVYIPNPTGNISYLKMQNRNPDCTSYIGQYFATINDV